MCIDTHQINTYLSLTVSLKLYVFDSLKRTDICSGIRTDYMFPIE